MRWEKDRRRGARVEARIEGGRDEKRTRGVYPRESKISLLSKSESRG